MTAVTNMEKTTIPSSIVEYLTQEWGNWTFGGPISRHVAIIHNCKEEIVSRRLREMASETEENPRLIKRLVTNPNGKGAPVIQYRLNPEYKLQLDHEKRHIPSETPQTTQTGTSSEEWQTADLSNPETTMGIMQTTNQKSLW